MVAIGRKGKKKKMTQQDKRDSLRFSLWVDGRTTRGQPVTTTTYCELMEEIVFAEQLGFHGIWTTEHHGFRDGYLPAPFTFLASVAARTQTMCLDTNVLLLPLWPIRLLAEEAAVLDVLSGGRLTLGVGLGYVQHEFAAFGVDRSTRRERMEAGIQYLRAAFQGERVPDGYQGMPLPLSPQPAQHGHLPIYMGGTSDAGVARLADGFLAETNVDPVRTLTDQWKRLKPHVERHGRESRLFPVIASTRMWVSDDPERDWATILAPALAYQTEVYARMGTDAGHPQPPGIDPHTLQRTSLLIDTQEKVVNMIRQMQTSAPLREICFWSHLPGVSHEAAMAHLERVSKHILPHFSAKEA